MASINSSFVPQVSNLAGAKIIRTRVAWCNSLNALYSKKVQNLFSSLTYLNYQQQFDYYDIIYHLTKVNNQSN